MQKNRVILLIGGNLGNRRELIHEAKILISENKHKIIQESSLYESEPWGFSHAQDFINQVIEINSASDPKTLMVENQLIEKTLGRKTKTRKGYEGRTMDIDILFFNDEIIQSTDLIIPHPKLHERKFTLLPLVEKWAGLIHPVFNKDMSTLFKECKDEGRVNRIP